ncbi:succinate dehydrogenase flavoprotein subunit A [Estrella lausannensis]|uniref:Succinate dehydrogenase flavoprotein subunit A n=1 Tax=Estrella lausannensis TaxID=483423 RepID=A0A0H5DN63_9BACT|nr:hypothetical protein [Estrella lausannensis]CRX37537.1 succinate dehydrogenase flavoprotein subunit A [Estrella lausannensis]
MTNIPGIFNVGESDYQYHGANRLGANSLLSCIFAGLVAGGEIPKYIASLQKNADDASSTYFDDALAIEESFKQQLFSSNGPENIFKLHEELAETLISHVTVKRNNADLKTALAKIHEVKERYGNISLSDKSSIANQSYIFANQFAAMLDIALIITKGALLRDEFRGAHYKPDFPSRDDQNWLKTTIATFDPHESDPVISYEAVDTRHLKPLMRDYTKAKKEIPTLENIPSNITFPA